MGFGESNGNGMGPADIAAVMGNNGYGNGNGMFGDGSWWIIVLLIMMFCCGGMNNGNGIAGMLPYFMMNQQQPAVAQPVVPVGYGYDGGGAVQRGFDQAAVMGAIGNVQGAVTTGFGDTALGLASLGRDVMAQGYQGQIAMLQGFNAQQSQFANCCCENRLGVANLGADIAREACADRQAVNEAFQGITMQGNNNTNAIINAITQGTQSIKDDICDLRIETKDNRIAELERKVMMAEIEKGNVAQNAFFAQGMNQEVDALYNRLKNCPVNSVPVYGPQPIFTYQGNGNTCPCGA